MAIRDCWIGNTHAKPVMEAILCMGGQVGLTSPK